MTTPPCLAKTTTFYQLLEETPGLDGRDNRGKKHAMALVLTGLVLALCCGRDGNLSGLHRHIVNHFEALCQATQTSHPKPISRAQLPLLLAKVNGTVFATLLFNWFGIRLDADTKRWFALDGKDLRGSIEPGHKRGQACVSAVAHHSQEVINQVYYTGSKESERPVVRQLLTDTDLYRQKLTLDALHLIPLTINAIQLAKGVYVVGLKPNQAHLYRYCLLSSLVKKPIYERADGFERGHGRLEQRTYSCFRITVLGLASRWQDSGMTSLIKVRRIRQNLDGTQFSQDISYFVSNSEPTRQSEADELFDAIRQHWRVEVMHYQRDVTLSEDALKTGNASVSRLMSSLRTLTINLLKRIKSVNMAAQLDNFADKFQTLIQFMTQQLIL